ncbi:DUF1810 domain-containing protein [Rhizobium sp. KVB221]|uniref:DUF1810 domain-containing protein n=1 Tax=Rhizobium setariae TaxID=2801340 RepID=A0A936YUT6_9HYPH|nr:DUF1810 domain-containing protein [Rhizobium setariae]MBL0373741.1 DUF1810 domain-containing protein [Rhizobium setariae]
MTEQSSSFDLHRFVAAQETTFERALAELEAGQKRSHWMWFIFPQLHGLGSSPTAQRYGLVSIVEARAYLAHPLLGPRLERCTMAVLHTQGLTLHQIFGAPDDMKFRSSMTLFALASADGNAPYKRALDRFWEGEMDQRTLDLLKIG